MNIEEVNNHSSLPVLSLDTFVSFSPPMTTNHHPVINSQQPYKQPALSFSNRLQEFHRLYNVGFSLGINGGPLPAPLMEPAEGFPHSSPLFLITAMASGQAPSTGIRRGGKGECQAREVRIKAKAHRSLQSASRPVIVSPAVQFAQPTPAPQQPRTHVRQLIQSLIG